MDYRQINEMSIPPGTAVRITRQFLGFPPRTTIVYYSHVEDGSLGLQKLYFAGELINDKLPKDKFLDYFYTESIMKLELLQ